jgi:hypothetical protein
VQPAASVGTVLVEGRRKLGIGPGLDPAGGRRDQERSGPVAEGGDCVAIAPAALAPGKMMFDFHALRPAQRLVEIGV